MAISAYNLFKSENESQAGEILSEAFELPWEDALKAESGLIQEPVLLSLKLWFRCQKSPDLIGELVHVISLFLSTGIRTFS
jgi:hypothetical protein